MMNPDDYKKWKNLQRAANDAMILSGDHKNRGEQDWHELYQKAIKLQQTANAFPKSADPKSTHS
jgi:hypothetical protein